MLAHSESLSHPSKRRKLPIPGVVINTALYNPIQIATSRLIGIENQILEVKQRQQAGRRRGHNVNELKRKKRLLDAERAYLTSELIKLTATQEAKEVKPIVHSKLRQKTLAERLPTSWLKSLSMAAFALSTLFTPQAVVLAQDGQPTPEASGTIPLTQRYSLLFRKTDNGLIVSAKSDPKFWNEPNLTVGQVVGAVSNKFGIANQKTCATQVVTRNIYNIETETAAQRRLNKKEVSSGERQIVIEAANTVIDFINDCSLKAKQIIQTVIPSITSLPPSKIPPTALPTKAQPSSTPVQPTSTSRPQAEAPSKTDATGEYIKYGLGGALVVALLGLGSLAALVIHNNKDEEKKEKSNSVTLRHLPSETVVDDPRVLPLSGQGQPFKVHVGDGKPELPVTFEPRVLVMDTDDPNLLQRVLNTIAKAIKREDSDIVRAQAAALMHHERGHAEKTSAGVAIIGVIRNQETKEIIGAAVTDPNSQATAAQRKEMFLGPDDPSAHDIKNAGRADEEIKKRKK